MTLFALEYARRHRDAWSQACAEAVRDGRVWQWLDHDNMNA